MEEGIWVLVNERKMKTEWIDDNRERFKMRLKSDQNDYRCQLQKDLPENNRKKSYNDLKDSKKKKIGK